MRVVILAVSILFLSGCKGPGADPDGIYAFEPRSLEPTIERIYLQAARGSADAQALVAYHKFTIGERDTAVALWKRLAEEDHLGSIETLAMIYQQGRGVAIDYEESARWLARAAALGSEKAARDLDYYRSRRE